MILGADVTHPSPEQVLSYSLFQNCASVLFIIHRNQFQALLVL